MDRRFLLVLGLSLVVALIISTIFYRMTAGSQGTRAESGEQKDIVLAAKPLPVGSTVKAADLRMGKIPADQFPKGAFSKIEEVIDRPVVSNILLDEAVQEGRLAARGSGLGLAPTIPVGMRGVTVRVSDVAGVAGYVLPGLRVDVLVTGRPPGDDGNITTTCLQNMLVLSSGQTMQADPRGQPINTPTVTLLATPEQAEILTLAGNSGSIQLVLRNGSDTEINKTPGRDVAELYGRGAKVKPASNSDSAPVVRRPRPRPVETPVAVAPPPPPPPPEVIVIRGNNKSVERVAN
jgi:pilus assembly protein CpaB